MAQKDIWNISQNSDQFYDDNPTMRRLFNALMGAIDFNAGDDTLIDLIRGADNRTLTDIINILGGGSSLFDLYARMVDIKNYYPRTSEFSGITTDTGNITPDVLVISGIIIDQGAGSDVNIFTNAGNEQIDSITLQANEKARFSHFLINNIKITTTNNCFIYFFNHFGVSVNLLTKYP